MSLSQMVAIPKKMAMNMTDWARMPGVIKAW